MVPGEVCGVASFLTGSMAQDLEGRGGAETLWIPSGVQTLLGAETEA